MCVCGDDVRIFPRPDEAAERSVCVLLAFCGMRLELNINLIEDALHAPENLMGLFFPACRDETADFACLASCCANDALSPSVCLDDIKRGARLFIKALRACVGDDLKQIGKTGFVFGEEHKMVARLRIGAGIGLFGLVFHCIDLAADDWFDPLLLAGLDIYRSHLGVSNKIIKAKKCISTNVYTLCFGGNRKVKNAADKLYANAHVFLERKYERYKEL